MKTYIFLILAMCSNYILAQRLLDTIYANDQKNVALFFPRPIRQGITGSENFVFTYNREKQQYFGLLQAQPGTESNLLAITDDGGVYSYILRYADTLPRLNYFIPENESIGNEKPIIKPITAKNIDSVSGQENSIKYFKRFSEYLLKLKGELSIATKRKKGIKIQLQRVMYQANEVYLVIEVKNNSGIDFDIDYLNIYRANGNIRRKASYQRLTQDVIYKYNLPDVFKDKQTERFVYVLPKFVLGNNEKLEIELAESKGSREVVLNFKNQ